MKIKSILFNGIYNMIVAFIWGLLTYHLGKNGISATIFYIITITWFILASAIAHIKKGDKDE